MPNVESHLSQNIVLELPEEVHRKGSGILLLAMMCGRLA